MPSGPNSASFPHPALQWRVTLFLLLALTSTLEQIDKSARRRVACVHRPAFLLSNRTVCPFPPHHPDRRYQRGYFLSPSTGWLTECVLASLLAGYPWNTGVYPPVISGQYRQPQMSPRHMMQPWGAHQPQISPRQPPASPRDARVGWAAAAAGGSSSSPTTPRMHTSPSPAFYNAPGSMPLRTSYVSPVASPRFPPAPPATYSSQRCRTPTPYPLSLLPSFTLSLSLSPSLSLPLPHPMQHTKHPSLFPPSFTCHTPYSSTRRNPSSPSPVYPSAYLSEWPDLLTSTRLAQHTHLAIKSSNQHPAGSSKPSLLPWL